MPVGELADLRHGPGVESIADVPNAAHVARWVRLQMVFFDGPPEHRGKERPGVDRDNRIFRIRFDDATDRISFKKEYGYATKWAEYHLGDIELPEVTTSPIEVTTRPTDDDDRQDMFLERHRLGIASYFDIDPDAVNISVDLVYRDKDGVLRTAFK
jgi:hypothetical protein